MQSSGCARPVRGVGRQGWFEGTFDVITQDWDMRSQKSEHVFTATAAQTHGAQSRDREVFLEKPSKNEQVNL